MDFCRTTYSWKFQFQFRALFFKIDSEQEQSKIFTYILPFFITYHDFEVEDTPQRRGFEASAAGAPVIVKQALVKAIVKLTHYRSADRISCSEDRAKPLPCVTARLNTFVLWARSVRLSTCLGILEEARWTERPAEEEAE